MTEHRTPAQVLATAARAAGLAPSVHNTQPWLWRVHRDRLDLYAQRDRQLKLADPDGRLLTISCGAALHHARVALAAEGWQSLVEPLPSPADPDHLATIRLGEHAGAAAEAVRRFQLAQVRRTDRRPLANTPVPDAALAAIRAAVEAERAHLHLLRPEQVAELALAASRADELAETDERQWAELAHWVGGPRPGTGVPAETIPTQPPRTTVPERDFGRAGTLAVSDNGDRAATYGVIFGEVDAPPDWLAAGQALSAAWLAATERGIALLPFSSPVEVPATRTVLRHLLAGIGHPFLALRLGVPDPDRPGPPHTPRLAPSETVEIVDAADAD
ncbi:MAG TPA: nitroreductase [Natronosporangium sp.]